MEILNLQHHTPDQFVGKTVTVRGRHYRIGVSFRVNDQGYSHYLINDMSGLCLHIIQIRNEYMSDPSSATQASQLKEKLTAELRTNMQKESNTVEIPIITVTEANGGCFELHETSWGMFGCPEEPPVSELIQEASAFQKENDFPSAVAILKNVLTEFPYHTVALNNLAFCYESLGNITSAIAVMDQVIEIEPNYVQYLGNRVIYALNTPRRRQALELFHQMKAQYPRVPDYDYYGIHAFLCCGATDEASNLLKSLALPKQQVDELSTLVSAAVVAKKQFALLDKAICSRQTPISAALTGLQKIYASYESNPLVQANLGLALFRDGQYERAARLLMMATGGIADKWMIYCWANAAFCQIEQGNWVTGMQLLNHTMLVLNALGPKMNAFDAPGIATWINDETVQESNSPSAAEIVDKAIATCPDKILITEEVRQLAALYRQAAAQYANSANQNTNTDPVKPWWSRFW